MFQFQPLIPFFPSADCRKIPESNQTFSSQQLLVSRKHRWPIGCWLKSVSSTWQSWPTAAGESATRNKGGAQSTFLTAQSWSWIQQHQFAASFDKLVNKASPTEYCLLFCPSEGFCPSLSLYTQRKAKSKYGGRGERSIGGMFFSFSTWRMNGFSLAVQG